MRGLIASKEIEVRFSDTDAMGVIWHGNYLRYFEDGLNAIMDRLNVLQR